MYALIHAWWSSQTTFTTPGRRSVLVTRRHRGNPSLNRVSGPMRAWASWSMGSLFRRSTVLPTGAAWTCGAKRQPTLSSAMARDRTADRRRPAPCNVTTTFRKPRSGSTRRLSSGTAEPQKARSLWTRNAFGGGGLPRNRTVPAMAPVSARTSPRPGARPSACAGPRPAPTQRVRLAAMARGSARTVRKLAGQGRRPAPAFRSRSSRKPRTCQRWKDDEDPLARVRRRGKGILARAPGEAVRWDPDRPLAGSTSGRWTGRPG